MSASGRKPPLVVVSGCSDFLKKSGFAQGLLPTQSGPWATLSEILFHTGADGLPTAINGYSKIFVLTAKSHELSSQARSGQQCPAH
jgi:hypothetical protein